MRMRNIEIGRERRRNEQGETMNKPLDALLESIVLDRDESVLERSMHREF